MDCPVCGEKMREIGKYGVEMDICMGCKGVWMDYGDLEEIVELASEGGLPGQHSDDEDDLHGDRKHQGDYSERRGLRDPERRSVSYGRDSGRGGGAGKRRKTGFPDRFGG